MTEFADSVYTAAIVYDVTSREPSSTTTLVEDVYPFGDGKGYPHSSRLTVVMRDLDDRGLDLVSLTVRDA